jgi:hypothetical protein
MTKQSETLEKSNTLVRYQYIPRRVRGISDSRHLLYDGKLDSSIDSFSILRNEAGKYVFELSEAEEKFVIEGLGLNPTDLNRGNRNNEYLQSIDIEMPKAGIRLNLNDPWDLFVDRILQAYTNVFAPSKRLSKKKISYRYMRIKADEEVDIILENADLRKKAYKLLCSLEESREKMIMYLLNEGVRLHRQISTKDVRKLVNDRVEKGYKKFIDTLEEPLFLEKGIINMGVVVGSIQEKNKLYYYDEQPMASDGEPAKLTNAAIFLKDKANAQIRVAITKDTVNGFNGTE